MKISGIRIYPIKSMGGISLNRADFDRKGLLNDRRWMLVGRDDGRFLSQREHPSMAAFRIRILTDGLKVSSPSGASIGVPFAPGSGDSVGVSVWGTRCRGEAYRGEVDAFFSDELGAHVRLVKISESRPRKVDARYAVHSEDQVGFADGYPFLIASTASLRELNARLECRVPMDRFRPNFIVTGSEPFSEDSWKRVRLGRTEFHVVKPCGRCVIITVDQKTGVKGPADPLSVLSDFRLSKRGGKSKVLFGQNMIAEPASGTVRVGDAVRVLETRRPPRFEVS